MSRSLFDIGQDFYALHDLASEVYCDPETGEIINQDEELESLFLDIKKDLEYKLDNAEYIRKELIANADAIKAERYRLYTKEKALRNKADRLKDIMLSALRVSGQSKLKTLSHSFSISKRKSVNIIDEELIGRAYMRIKHEVDKKKIGDALKAGETVEGAEFVEKESLGVR
jgi:hypothetical protein